MRSATLNNNELNALRNVSYAQATVFAGLHAGNPGITGANEVTGGSYIRQAITFGAAATSAMNNSGALNFTGMPAVAAPGVTHISLWSAATAGTFLWAGPMATTRDVRAFEAAATGSLFTAYGHAYTTAHMVDFVQLFDGALPTGIAAFTNYFVVTPTAGTTFQVSLTSGGAAVTVSANGSGLVRRIIPLAVASGDTVNVAVSALVATEI